MARRITATRKAWDELTRDEKADLVHKEKRQLCDLLDQLADRIVAFETNVEKIWRALDHPMLGKPMRAAIRGGRRSSDRMSRCRLPALCSMFLSGTRTTRGRIGWSTKLRIALLLPR
jgi:hypothetical protein